MDKIALLTPAGDILRTIIQNKSEQPPHARAGMGKFPEPSYPAEPPEEFDIRGEEAAAVHPDSRPNPAQPGIDPKGAAGAAKAPLHLLPLQSLGGVARVLATGADKYGRMNWRSSKVESDTYIAASLRHIAEWQDGADTDAESGLHPLDHAIASLMILRDAQNAGTLADTRPQKLR